MMAAWLVTPLHNESGDPFLRERQSQGFDPILTWSKGIGLTGTETNFLVISHVLHRSVFVYRYTWLPD